VLIGKMIKKRG